MLDITGNFEAGAAFPNTHLFAKQFTAKWAFETRQSEHQQYVTAF